MANTMTIAQKYDVLAEVIKDMGISFEDGTTALDFLADRKVKATKKSSTAKAKAPSKAQTFLRNHIVEILTSATAPMSVGEILEAMSGIEIPEEIKKDVKMSTSSITANIGVMLQNGKTPNPDGIIVRDMVGKVAKFRMAEGAEVDTEEEGE